MNGKSSAARLFGQGISFPPRIDGDGRLALSAGAENVRESIRVILLTQFKERMLLPEFGCGLQAYLFEPNTVATRRLIEEGITQALGRWEPRIVLESVAVSEDPQNPAAAVVAIHYKLVATQVRERLNLTLDFTN